MVFRRILVAAAAIWSLSVTPAVAGPVTFSDVYLFGTSEIDAGNWLLDPQLMNDTLAPTAAKGYWEGRWQEGPAWSDYLYQDIMGTYSTPSLAGGTNYAYGLGWLGTLNGVPPATPYYETLTQLWLSSQVTDVLGDHGGVLDPNALYVVSIGSNDFQFYSRTTQALARAALAVQQMQRMVDAGATNFLVQTVGGTDQWILDYNAAVKAGLALIPGINVTYVDTRTFNQTIIPPQLPGMGITDFGRCNLDPACLAAAQAAALLGQPYLGNTHFYFDGVHRSTKVNDALADYALAQVVPEPGTMTLLATGLGAALIWRRKRLRA